MVEGDDDAGTGEDDDAKRVWRIVDLVSANLPGGRRWPATAERLMRSRFEAFRSGDLEWLLASWHPSTRPASVDLSGNPDWQGLQIVDTVDGGPDDETGIVEFRASCSTPHAGLGVHHERSRFVRPRSLVLPRWR